MLFNKELMNNNINDTIIGYYGIYFNKISKYVNIKNNTLLYAFKFENNNMITGKIYKLPYLKYFSIKYYKCIKKLNRLVYGKKGASTAFIYSNLVKIGINMFAETLIQNGYLEYQENSANYQISANTVCHFCGKTYESHRNNLNDSKLERENININQDFRYDEIFC